MSFLQCTQRDASRDFVQLLMRLTGGESGPTQQNNAGPTPPQNSAAINQLHHPPSLACPEWQHIKYHMTTHSAMGHTLTQPRRTVLYSTLSEI